MPRLDDYEYGLPEDLIARHPVAQRRASRLLHWRGDDRLDDRQFSDLPDLLRAGDVLVLNETKVFPARLRGKKAATGGAVEALLLCALPPREDGRVVWEAMLRPGRRLPPGCSLILEGGLEAEAGSDLQGGRRELLFARDCDVLAHAHAHGLIPLPPYLQREATESDRERYQTVFARIDGSVAAPTASLHFDEAMLKDLRAKDHELLRLTLHVGYGTFRPLEEEDLQRNRLHREVIEIPESTRERVRAIKSEGRRIVALGTTACRALESLPEIGDPPPATDLFLKPGDKFRWVDALVTNFHLPRSSLLMLVHAFAGDRWREAYVHAVAEGYRFYSYGDANFIERSEI